MKIWWKSDENPDENLMKIWWKSDKNLMKIWWKFDENLIKIWWKSDENLMKIWWKSDENLMKIWWKSDENLMKIWWKSDENLMKIVATIISHESVETERNFVKNLIRKTFACITGIMDFQRQSVSSWYADVYCWNMETNENADNLPDRPLNPGMFWRVVRPRNLPLTRVGSSEDW